MTFFYHFLLMVGFFGVYVGNAFTKYDDNGAKVLGYCLVGVGIFNVVTSLAGLEIL